MANKNLSKWNEVMNEGPKTEANETTWPAWKRVCVVLLGAVGIVGLLLGAAYWIYVSTYGSISAPVKDGFHQEFQIVAYAATTESASEYEEADSAKFEDNTLEYWEIAGLVERYNPQYLNQLKTFYSDPAGLGVSREALLEMAEEFRNQASYLKEEAKYFEEDEDDTIYREYKKNIKSLNRFAKEMEDAASGKAVEAYASKRALHVAKYETTAELQAMMCEYQNLHAQAEIQKKNLEIAELTYQGAVRQRELGLYAAEDLLSAERARDQALAAAHTAETERTECRQTLLRALGWPHDANAEILPVPEPNLKTIDGYSEAEDAETMLYYNYDLSDVKRSSAADHGGVREKNKKIQETEDSVRMKAKVLYGDVMQKKAAYETQIAGLEAAVAKKAQADRSYTLGMLSRQEYLAAEVTWLTAKADVEKAGLDLMDAMETYEWALKGLMEL